MLPIWATFPQNMVCAPSLQFCRSHRVSTPVQFLSISLPHRKCLLSHQGTPNCSLHNLSWFSSHSQLSLEALKLLLLAETFSSFGFHESDFFPVCFSFPDRSFDFLVFSFLLHAYVWTLTKPLLFSRSLSSSLATLPSWWPTWLCLLLPLTPHGWRCFRLSFWLQKEFCPRSGMIELVLNP